MKRIFYFTGHRLTVLHWSGKKFSGACSFEPDYAGLDKFEQYLNSSARLSTKLLIDVIEEDFRTETIPHVHGKDRKAVLSRQLDKLYRSSRQYTHYEITGRKKSGRKDDEVLLGAITDPGLLAPWMDIIERADIPLSGIWTLPLISKSILPLLNAGRGPVLLVSQQVNSTLRQTYFRDGKMYSSRQSVINQDANNVSNIGRYARPEIQRTIEFLSNQRFINAQEVVQVHVLGATVQADSIQKEIESDETKNIVFHHIDDIHKKLGITGAETHFADVLFAWVCLSNWRENSHYGTSSEFKRYQYSLVNRSMYVACVAAMLVAAVMTELNISKALESARSMELLNQQEQGYKAIYNKKYQVYENVFKNARGMNAAVDLVSQIEQHAAVSPLDLYIELGKVLDQAQFSGVEINKVSWTKQQYSAKTGGQVPADKVDMASADKIKHVATIEGRIPVTTDDYGRSVSQVNSIVLALLKHDRVESVEAIKMPVEVRPNKKFAAESGVDGRRYEKNDMRGVFSLQLVMRGVDSV